MTVVWFVLRDKDQIWFELKLLQMRDAWLALLVRDGEDGVENDRWTHNPRVHQDRE